MSIDVDLDDDADLEQDLDTDGGDAAEDESTDVTDKETVRTRLDWKKAAIYAVIPMVALLLAGAAALFKYQEATLRDDAIAGAQATQAAKDSTVSMLSYEPATVDATLGAAARDLLAGDFQDAYTTLINDVVVPGAKEKQISAVATVPAASLVSVDGTHAVVLVFVNQTTVIGDGAPTATASTIRVTLDEIDGRWLVTQFEPV